MIKVDIANTYANPGESSIIWSGDLPALPRESDIVWIGGEDWIVKAVHFTVETASIEISVSAPQSDEQTYRVMFNGKPA